jgi:DNA helicase-2/ATP-dependent DNA helicase PcrA
MKQTHFEDTLNDPQREAVLFREGSLLVIAGAGSGKTRTLTHRVAALVREGIPPGAILLLTFTRKASAEMIRRASELLDERCGQVSGGTFHSFANAVLRKYSTLLGFPGGFAIIDESDAEDLVSLIRKELDLSGKDKAFPSKKTLMSMFSRSVNKVLPMEDIVCNEYPHFSSYMEDIVSVHREYGKRKKLHGFFDYDDLLVELRNLLSEHPDLCEKISSSFRYIMVDEYQDTNKIQAEILRLLARANRNVMVVGDDSQSIYSFRGANFRNIMDFPDLFPGARMIRLEENFRSVQPILSLTNHLIDQAAEKFTKRLFTKKKAGNAPVLVSTGDEKAQSLFVVNKINELLVSGASVHDMAVLFRAGFHSFDLELELNRKGIAFNKVGGFKFVESAHIKDLLAHLKVLFHPKDRLSWYRILSLVDHVGPKKAQTIFETLTRENQGYKGILLDVFPAKAAKSLESLRSLYASFQPDQQSVYSMGEIALNYYMPILKSRFDDWPKRQKDLEQLLVIMERYDELKEFLTDMTLEPPNTSSNNSLEVSEESRRKLTLSTIHSAKGLEWHTVFVIWVLDGRFPSIHAIENDDALEEERRLLYVAATRARENLFFVYPRNFYDRNLRMLFSNPSRFLADIPDTLLEKQYLGSAGFNRF